MKDVGFSRPLKRLNLLVPPTGAKHFPASSSHIGGCQSHDSFRRHDQAPRAFAQLPLGARPGAAVPGMAGAIELCAGPSLGWQPVHQEAGDDQIGSTATREGLWSGWPREVVDLTDQESDLDPKAAQHVGSGRG